MSSSLPFNHAGTPVHWRLICSLPAGVAWSSCEYMGIMTWSHRAQVDRTLEARANVCAVATLGMVRPSSVLWIQTWLRLLPRSPAFSL
jgi:hypothetical protein